jgi:hypothetical protein
VTQKIIKTTRSNKSTFKTLFQILLHVIGMEAYFLATCIRLASKVNLLSRDQFCFRQNDKVSLVHVRKGIQLYVHSLLRLYPGRLTPGKEPRYPRNTLLIGPRSTLNVLEKTELYCPFPDSKPGPSSP